MRYRGKTVDIATNSDRHPTSISRFLRYEEWDNSALEKAMRKLVISIIYEEFRRSGKPILYIVDIPCHPKQFLHRKRLIRLK